MNTEQGDPVMEITAPSAHAAAVRAAPQTNDASSTMAARVGAGVVLLGTLITTLGISWDVQWHKTVGPDTFFTLPHLALYSGSALAGIASLVKIGRASCRERV